MAAPGRALSKQVFYGGQILLVCVLWGLSNPLLKIGANAAGPFTLITLRFFVGFAAFMLPAGDRVVRGLRGVRILPILAVCVCMSLAFMSASFSLMLTKATIAGFLMGLSALITPFLEPLLLGRGFRWRVLPLAAVVAVGMYLLTGGEGAFGIGEILALACSFVFALMLTLTEKYIEGVDAISLSAMQCGVGMLLCLPCALLFEGMPDVGAIGWTGWGVLLYLSLVGTCLACLLQNTAMRHISATYASLAFCTEPVFTAAFSFLLLGETLTAQGFVGAGIVLAGVMAASVMRT